MSLHITAKKGEIADKILLPGDPLRAKYIAENFLDNAVCVNELRGALCYSGTYKGQRVSVMGTGMGIPSMMIYATELCRDYGCEKLIRLGTGASFTPELKMMDLVLSQATSYTSSINDYIFKGTYAPCADFELLDKAYHLGIKNNLRVKAGNTICYDLLYRDDKNFEINTWQKYGVIAGEMEAAGLYTVAAEYGKKALALITIVVELAKSTDVTGNSQNQAVSVKDRETGLNDMIRLALETLIAE